MQSETNVVKSGGVFNFRNETYEWIEAVVFSLAVVVLIFTFVFRIVGVDGSSMNDTLMNGDRVVISDINYTPRQGDIIVFSTKAFDEPLIKRVIATQGQTVNINYDTNTVYVNGKAISQPYIKQDPDPMETYTDDPVQMPLTVPKGYVFVMGDHRNNSEDSRCAVVGFVDTRYILGKAVVRIFPFSEFKSLTQY
jgi:signal peptidase I